MNLIPLILGLQIVLLVLGLVAFAVGVAGTGGWGVASIPLVIAGLLIALLELPKRGR